MANWGEALAGLGQDLQEYSKEREDRFERQMEAARKENLERQKMRMQQDKIDFDRKKFIADEEQRGKDNKRNDAKLKLDEDEFAETRRRNTATENDADETRRLQAERDAATAANNQRDDQRATTKEALTPIIDSLKARLDQAREYGSPEEIAQIEGEMGRALTAHLSPEKRDAALELLNRNVPASMFMADMLSDEPVDAVVGRIKGRIKKKPAANDAPMAGQGETGLLEEEGSGALPPPESSGFVDGAVEPAPEEEKKDGLFHKIFRGFK